MPPANAPQPTTLTVAPGAARDLPLRCACGQVQGWVRDVSPKTVTRTVCHCNGCQSYAHALGIAAAQLNARGGSDLVQIAPDTLRIDQGLEQVACLQQTRGGALRWHARCCNTPLAGTLPTMHMPFVSLSQLCVSLEGAPPDTVFGPVMVQVNHSMSRAEARANRGTLGALLAMLRRYIGLILSWWLRGRTKPFPFFEAGRPRVQPRRLTAAERAVIPADLLGRLKPAPEDP